MAPFVGKDPRGYPVVLYDGAWRHAQPHFMDMPANVQIVYRTLQDPDLILDNPVSDNPNRIAQERYIRFEPDVKAHIVIPAITMPTGTKIVGYGTVDDARVVVTIHTKPVVPSGTPIWVRKP